MTQARNTSLEASLEARFGARVAAALNEGTRELPHDIGERLRFARTQALAKAAQAQRPVATAMVAGRGGAALLGGPPAWWQRLATALPLAVLVGGLYLVNEWTLVEQVRAAAEIDAELLSDNLPPEAYSDPAFGEYLRSGPSLPTPAPDTEP
jgi:hypothetical protein